jgi:peptidoglycan/LPS O-acetylase OafA/YrhL
MKKLHGLDSIRFICACWVLVDHLGLPPLLTGIDTSSKLGWLIKAFYGIIVSGPAAVIIFFVISGFCIHYPYKNGEIDNWFIYYARRYLRIGIPLLAAICLYKFLDPSLVNFENSILWSLYAELIYYTIYPAVRFFKKYLGWKNFILISFGFSFLVILLDPKAGNYPSYGIAFNWILGLPCWLFGCRLAETSDKLVNLPYGNIWKWRFIVLLASWFCKILRFHSSIGYPYTLNLFAIIVFLWLQKEILFFNSHKPSKFLEWAGVWSYSIYLMHVPAATILKKYAFVPNLGYILNWLILIVFTLLISYTFYFFIEKPSHKLAKKFKEFKPRFLTNA